MFDSLFLGTNKHVLSLDAATGQQVWKTKLPNGGAIVAILVRPEGLFAASQGYVHRLDPQTGKILWTNGLSGLGYNPIMLAMMPYWEETATDALIASAAQRIQQAAAAHGAG